MPIKPINPDNRNTPISKFAMAVILLLEPCTKFCTRLAPPPIPRKPAILNIVPSRENEARSALKLYVNIGNRNIFQMQRFQQNQITNKRCY